MTVNSINNIVYLKESKIADADTRKGERKKADENASPISADAVNVRDVEQENKTAGANPPIQDLEQARQVLRSVVELLDRSGDKGLLSHTGKVIDPNVA